MSAALRRATADDVAFLVGLVGDRDVAPYLSARRATTEAEVAAEVARSEAEPDAFGVLVIEAEGERVPAPSPGSASTGARGSRR